MTNTPLIPALIAPLVGWRLYRRFGGNVGRQPYAPRRLTAVLGVTLGFTAFFAPAFCCVAGARWRADAGGGG